MTTPTAPAATTAERRWLDIPWHPTVFAITIVLAYWLDTVVSPYAAVRAIVVAAAFGILLTLACLAATRSAAWAGVVSTGVLVLLYSKHLVDVASVLGGVAPIWVLALWLVLLLLALALAARLMRRRIRRMSVRRANRLLNWAALVYLGASVVLAITSGKAAHAIADLTQGEPSLAQSTADSAATSGPDIYLILVDGYPRVDVLREAFDFDNAAFLASLEERGFDVAPESVSAYLWTQQSLASMLHMDYVEDIPDFMAVLDGRAARQPTLRDIVNDNPTFDLARREGYEVVATGYEFEELALRQADTYLDPGYLNEFELQLLVSTFAGDIVGSLFPDFAADQHRAWIESQVRAPGEIAASAGTTPRLVIGHVSAPHQPTVFGADGEPVHVPLNSKFYADSPLERGQPTDEFISRYRAQLPYLNERLLGMVDEILSASSQPPVIVLWADHGSASRVDWTVTSTEEASADALRERTSTLFAALTPGRRDVFPDDVAPQDIVRYLADAYFETDLGAAARGDDVSPP